MSIGTTTALAIGLGASAGSGLVGAKLKSGAAKKAAKTQGRATQQAQRLQYQAAQQALAAQQAQFQRTNELYAPYTRGAPQSLAALYSYLGVPGGGAPPPGGMPPGGMPPPYGPMGAAPARVPSGVMAGAGGVRLGQPLPPGMGPRPGLPMPPGMGPADAAAMQGAQFGGGRIPLSTFYRQRARPSSPVPPISGG
jgi:hypothetical protein